MSILKHKFSLFFAPETITSGTGAIEDKALDKESAIEFLGQEDEPTETLDLEDKKTPKADKEDKKETKEAADDKKETSEEEDKELSLEEELESELNEDLDEDEAEVDAVAPPSRREILAKYPDLFKNFPQVEKAIYREQKYAELLPTIADAKTAVEKATQLDKYESEMRSGGSVSLLEAVRDNDREAFAKVVDEYLPTLYKVDQSAYYHIVGNTIKHTILSMVRDANEKQDEDLKAAAAILNKFVFGSETFTHPTKLSKTESVSDDEKRKETEISERERSFNERQFTNARDTLGTKVDNIIKATVDKVIDPTESMTGFVKKHATNEVLQGLEEAIKKDTRFRAVFDKLWIRAHANDYDAESMDRIKSAYLSKAKTLLPFLIKKARTEALRSNKKTDTTDKDKRGHLPVGKTRTSTSLASGNAKGSDKKESVPKGMSTLDYLNSD